MRAPYLAPAILVAAFASVGLLTGASAVMADSPPGDATANAKPPPPDPRIQVTIADQAAVEGSAVGPGIGYVIDPDPRATAGEYAVSVNWGDGSAPESAFLSQTQGGDQGGGTQFSINASHTYTDAGSYFIGVRVTDVDNRFNGASGGAIAVISEAPLTARGIFDALVNPYCDAVASWTDGNSAATSSEFTATIDWGDGSNSPAGVYGNGSGPYWAQGCHTYADLGPHTVTTTITDSALTVTAVGTAWVYAMTDGGTFVIGDGNAAVDSHVQFWGGDWASANKLSGGSAPPAFKGFAAGRSPICVGSWTSSPGASSNPPASVPSYTAVLVSNAISKDGPQVDGGSVHIALLRTDPGYGPDPDTPGTGSVVFMIC